MRKGFLGLDEDMLEGKHLKLMNNNVVMLFKTFL